MASAQSPVTRMANENKAVTKADIIKLVNYFQKSHKVIVELTALVNRLPSNQKLVVGNHSFGASDINTYSKVYINQLGDLPKVILKKNKRKNNKNANCQSKNLFYVSDQIVDLYKKSNLGYVDPSDHKSGKLSNEIDLIVDKHMATSGILTSLITNYIDANNLRSKDNNNRFVPDKHMIDSLSDCIYTLHGKSLAKRKFRPDTSPKKLEEIKEKLANGKLSAFERVKDQVTKRVSKESGKHEPFYDEEKGLLYTAMMKFNNYYRIPPCLLTDEEQAALKEEENIEASKVLQEKLSAITEHRKKSKE